MALLNFKSKKPFDVAILGTSGLPPTYGGFETLASQLVKHLSVSGTNFLIVADKTKSNIEQSGLKQIAIKYLPANGALSVIYDAISYLIGSSKSNLLLILGVSGTIFLPLIRVFHPNTGIIVHIDGLEWSRPKWSKFARSFLKLSERVAVHSADVVIVDNKGIAEYVKNTYGSRYLSRCYLVAYGALWSQPNDYEMVASPIPITIETTKQYIEESKYLLVLGRAEPENNFEMIIQSYIESCAFSKGISLVVVSNIFSTSYGKNLYLRFSGTPGVYLTDPIYDTKIVFSLRSNALAYIHGHSAGGTNPSLVESIAAAKPIIAYDVSYNRHTTNGIGVFFKTKEQLIQAINSVVTSAAVSLPELGKLATTNYHWDLVSQDYKQLFLSLEESKNTSYSTFFGRIKLRLYSKMIDKLIGVLKRLKLKQAKSKLRGNHAVPKSSLEKLK